MATQIQLNFCSIAFRHEPLEKIISRLANIGYDGIEVFFAHVDGMDATGLKAIRRQADEFQIQLPVFSPYFCLTRGPAEYDQTLRTATRAVEVAHVLGATKIRTFIDIGPDGLASAQATNAHWGTSRARSANHHSDGSQLGVCRRNARTDTGGYCGHHPPAYAGGIRPQPQGELSVL